MHVKVATKLEGWTGLVGCCFDNSIDLGSTSEPDSIIDMDPDEDVDNNHDAVIYILT